MVFSLVMLNAQIRVVAVEKLPISKTEQWSNAVFSPLGDEIYMTNSKYNGIWQYSLKTKLLKEITRDKQSGYNFNISDDGSKIAYRRTSVEGDYNTRVQESVELNIKSLNQTVIERGSSVRSPVFVLDRNSQSQQPFNDKTIAMQDQSQIQLLGIDDTKIILLRNGMKSIFDPFPKGKYIWPVLSPDKTKLVAVEMDRGAFVSDLDGKNIILLGKCNSPQWTRDGKWIIGMDDRDDGRSIYASEIIAISSDGSKHIQLTETPSLIEMFPATSPVENKIVTTSANGDVFTLTVEEEK